MGLPVIDLKGLEGNGREKTMAQLKDATENWGFFQIMNHGISVDLIEKVKKLTHAHHDMNLRPKFQESDVIKKIVNADGEVRDADWETVFFVQHLPSSTATQVPDINTELLKAIEEYEKEIVKLAERMLDLFCENLGLEEGYIKKVFSGQNGSGPFMGTKFAKYPSCPKSDVVKGLRTHTDAGGVILVLQDDIPGLQFLKGGEWVDVVPLADSIFVNTGDQLEVVSNGRIKSIPHRVTVREDGGRLSVATFYNPASDAVIAPAQKLLYPEKYSFEDYMKLYSGTKFDEKEPRFQVLKNDKTLVLQGQQLNGVVY
uniref:1-aminocyclopropane-1-carboxylate oxidase n=1 Tax=Potamogeton perfoliatus TaxID=55320 RepID=A0A7I6NFB5_9LILI|nr:1-aminocyclopropane-1-carboxylateoxidase [Potamogeton perfoliatus]